MSEEKELLVIWNDFCNNVAVYHHENLKKLGRVENMAYIKGITELEYKITMIF